MSSRGEKCLDQQAAFLSAASKICAVGLTEFLSMELPERKLLLSPWLPEQGLAMVYAPRGVGKTFFALSVAYAVSSGGSFLGWRAEHPRPVLYIDGEMPAVVLQERLAAIALSNDKEAQDFQLITPDLQPFGVPDLSTEQGQNAISKLTERADLIVLDNISTLCRTGKENEAESWLSMQDWALRLRARGKSVLFVHHSGKQGQQRGTSRREDVLDTVINLREPPDHGPEDGAKFQVRFTKSRGFFGKDAAPMEVALVTDTGGRQLWTFDSLADSTYKRVVEMCKDGLTQAEIARELEVNRSTVSRYIKKAKQGGLS